MSFADTTDQATDTHRANLKAGRYAHLKHVRGLLALALVFSCAAVFQNFSSVQDADSIHSSVWGINRQGAIFEYEGDGNWHFVPGSLSVIQIGNPEAVWGLNAAGSIFQYDGANRVWANVPGHLRSLSVGTDGAVWGLDTDDSIYRLQVNRTWLKVPGAFAQLIVGNAGSVWGIDRAGAASYFNGAGWTLTPSNLRQLSVGADGATWGISANGQVFRYSAEAGWISVPGQLSIIRVGNAGNVWGLNGRGNIFRFNGATGAWDQTPGVLTNMSVANDGAPWGVAPNEAIFHYNPRSGWVQVPGGLTQIHSGRASALDDVRVAAAEPVWGINGIGEIFEYLGDGGWRTVSGRLAQIEIGNPQAIWGLDGSGTAYQLGEDGSWRRTLGVLAQISVGSDGDIWGVDAQNRIFRYVTDRGWLQIPGSLSTIKVGNAKAVWGLNNAGGIFRYDGGSWTNIPGSLAKISVAADGTVWGVNGNDAIFRFNGRGWDSIGGVLSQIYVGNMNSVWGMNRGGEVWYYDFTNSSWIKTAGLMARLSIGSDGDAWAVDASDHVYHYNLVSGWRPVNGGIHEIRVGHSSDSIRAYRFAEAAHTMEIQVRALGTVFPNGLPQGGISKYENTLAAYATAAGAHSVGAIEHENSLQMMIAKGHNARAALALTAATTVKHNFDSNFTSLVLPAGGLPAGSYQLSCSACSASTSFLTCACRASNGALLQSSLHYSQCDGSINNNNGRLSCAGIPDVGVSFPLGSYDASCSQCAATESTLGCACRTGDGKVNLTTLNYLKCTSPISNNGGVLSCAGNVNNPVTLPGGTYSQSCNSCSLNGSNLICNCKGPEGQLKLTAIDTSKCSGAINNNNGVLNCPGNLNGAPVPPPAVSSAPPPPPAGAYSQSCNACVMNGTTLNCQCARGNGTFNASAINVSTCQGAITNTFGILNCPGNLNGAPLPLPAGSYSQSCSSCAVNGAALSCNCNTGTGALNRTSISFQGCQGSINNDRGYLSCAGVPSSAPPPPPAGVYSQSCNACVMNGTTLSCQCARGNGTFNASAINVSTCQGGITNTFGVLNCPGNLNGAPVPPPAGSYSQSCNSCVMIGTTLSCQCGRGNGTFNASSINVSSCQGGITNTAGILNCPGNLNGAPLPLPVGSYSQSCNSCVMNGTTMSCQCARGNGTFNASSINVSNCQGAISNNFGNLSCPGYPAPIVQVQASPQVLTYPAGQFSLVRDKCATAGNFALCMQGDLNLVLYNTGSSQNVAVWSSATYTSAGCGPNCSTQFQGDGNLVVYNGPTAVFSSNTYGHPQALLKLSNQVPNLSIFDADGSTLWSSAPNFAAGNFRLNQNQSYVFNGVRLAMQGDGNLVMYNSSKQALWASNTPGQNCGTNQCFAVFQGDGNFVIYNGSRPIYSTGTYGHPTAVLNFSASNPFLSVSYPGALPTGSYLGSCNSCTQSGSIVSCRCGTTSGSLIQTSLDMSGCGSSNKAGNSNGRLVCE